MKLNDLKLSVCVVTYNQELYIRQCLQSIFEQITNFQFEVIVSDDFSTDGTRAILREFEVAYPEVIKVIYKSKNIGPYENFLFVHQQARGDYIAHIDGDDYCLPGKFQAQADLLDNDQNCNIVWHRMLIESSEGGLLEDSLYGEPNIQSLEFKRQDILQFITIGSHSSKMYRKKLGDFDNPNFEVVDYFANAEQVSDGVARFVSDRPYGVYRIGIGIASGGSKTREILVNCFYYFCIKYPEYRANINTAALTYLIADIKNMRKTWRIFLIVWLKTFHVASPFKLISSLKFIKRLNLKNQLKNSG